jgi:hypothetical protein
MPPRAQYKQKLALEKYFRKKRSDGAFAGINRCWKARIDWRNHINGFDMFAVSKGKGKLEKIFKNLRLSPPPPLWHFEEDLITLFSCSFVTFPKYSIEYFLQAFRIRNLSDDNLLVFLCHIPKIVLPNRFLQSAQSISYGRLTPEAIAPIRFMHTLIEFSRRLSSLLLFSGAGVLQLPFF